MDIEIGETRRDEETKVPRFQDRSWSCRGNRLPLRPARRGRDDPGDHRQWSGRRTGGRWGAFFQGHPLCGAPSRIAAVAPDPAADVVDHAPRRQGLFASLSAKLRPIGALHRTDQRRLPLSQCLCTRQAEPQALAGHGLDLWRQLDQWFGVAPALRWLSLRARWRYTGLVQLSPGSAGLFRPSALDGRSRTSRPSVCLWPSRSGRGVKMGPVKYRRVWRRPSQCDGFWRIRRGWQPACPVDPATGERPIRASHCGVGPRCRRAEILKDGGKVWRELSRYERRLAHGHFGGSAQAAC